MWDQAKANLSYGFWPLVPSMKEKQELNRRWKTRTESHPRSIFWLRWYRMLPKSLIDAGQYIRERRRPFWSSVSKTISANICLLLFRDRQVSGTSSGSRPFDRQILIAFVHWKGWIISQWSNTWFANRRWLLVASPAKRFSSEKFQQIPFLLRSCWSITAS